MSFSGANHRWFKLLVVNSLDLSFAALYASHLHHKHLATGTNISILGCTVLKLSLGSCPCLSGATNHLSESNELALFKWNLFYQSSICDWHCLPRSGVLLSTGDISSGWRMVSVRASGLWFLVFVLTTVASSNFPFKLLCVEHLASEISKWSSIVLIWAVSSSINLRVESVCIHNFANLCHSPHVYSKDRIVVLWGSDSSPSNMWIAHCQKIG